MKHSLEKQRTSLRLRSRACAIALACLLWLPGTSSAAPESIHMLVMIIAFADKSAPSTLRYRDGGIHNVSLNIPNAEDVFFTDSGSTAARYAEVSNGDLTLTGEVIEISVPLNILASTVEEWKPVADAAAVAQGKNLANYDRLAYLVPHGFSGQGGNAGEATPAEGWFWVSSPSPVTNHVRERTFDHEFGHTLGFPHASEIQAAGNVLETGDETDVMGSGDAVHTNAVNKTERDWLPGNRLQAHPLDASATYFMNGLADPANSLQVVTIDSHGVEPRLGVPVDTYLSFRRPIGFDQHLANTDDPYGTSIRNTVHLHLKRKDGKLFSYFDRALGAGDTHTIGMTTIEVLSISGGQAEVDVSQGTYFPNPPLASASAVGTHQVQSGTTVAYDITITNVDPAGTPFPSFYESSFTTPGAGWLVAWDSAPKEILVGLGATEVVSSLRITSPVGTPSGVYDIPLTLTNDTGSAGPVSTIVDVPYEVLPSPDTTPPPPPSGVFGNVFPGTGDDYIVLQWTEPPDTSDIHLYRTYRNGVLLPLPASKQAFYVDFFYSALETNVYVIRSMDMAGNLSPPTAPYVDGVLDTSPPEAATNLGVSSLDGMPSLGWDAASDDVWVAYYEVYRGGVFLALAYEPNFVDTTAPSGAVTYTVYAVDGSGNISPVSNAVEYGAPVPALPWLGLAALVLAILGGRNVVFSSSRRP